MPELRYYIVIQEQEVRVSATNSTDAVILAKRVLSNTMHPEDQIDVQAYPCEIGLSVREIKL